MRSGGELARHPQACSTGSLSRSANRPYPTCGAYKLSMDNPYESPSNTGIAPPSVPGTQQALVCELSDDAKGNLGLTSRITRIATVIAVLASLNEGGQIWRAFRSGSLSGRFASWHLLFGLNFLLAPSWLLLAWMLWKYSRSLDLWRRNGIHRTEATIEDQAKLWLAIGLVTFFILLRGLIFLRAF